MRPSRVATAPPSTIPSPSPAMVARRALRHSRSTCTPVLRDYRLARNASTEAALGKLHFATALLPDGWRDDVLVTVADGMITSIDSRAPAGDAERCAGIAVP